MQAEFGVAPGKGHCDNVEVVSQTTGGNRSQRLKTSQEVLVKVSPWLDRPEEWEGPCTKVVTVGVEGRIGSKRHISRE